jgi:hypothetical protein
MSEKEQAKESRKVSRLMAAIAGALKKLTPEERADFYLRMRKTITLYKKADETAKKKEGTANE